MGEQNKADVGEWLNSAHSLEETIKNDRRNFRSIFLSPSSILVGGGVFVGGAIYAAIEDYAMGGLYAGLGIALTLLGGLNLVGSYIGSKKTYHNYLDLLDVAQVLVGRAKENGVSLDIIVDEHKYRSEGTNEKDVDVIYLPDLKARSPPKDGP